MKVQTPHPNHVKMAYVGPLDDSFRVTLNTPDGPIPIFFRFCPAYSWSRRPESRLAGWRLRRIGPFVLAFRLGG
jgi:hypothetical protein